MIQKLALLAASVVAAFAIAGGLVVAGFAPQAPAADAVQVVDQAAPVEPAPTVQVDTIYLTPEVAPKEITVTKVKEVPRTADGEGAEHENEGGDD